MRFRCDCGRVKYGHDTSNSTKSFMCPNCKRTRRAVLGLPDRPPVSHFTDYQPRVLFARLGSLSLLSVIFKKAS